MSEFPLFSVLIANYNNGRYLLDAIESVRSQTYTNWEIVLVDDGSTDNSHELYRMLEQDSRIHIFFNEENKGCGYTKRRCAELANGKICGFLDADDCILPDTLSLMVTTHKENPEVALVFSRYYICDEQMRIIGESRHLMLKEGESYLEHRDYQPEVFASYKKTMYDKSEGLNPNIPLGVDQDLYFLLEEQGGLIVLDNITYKVRGHNDSISRVDGGNSAFFWNLLVRYNACMRRGLNPRQFPEKDFLDFLSERYCEEGAYDLRREAQEQIRQTYSYKLGKALLSPLKRTMRLISSKKDKCVFRR